MSYYNVPFPDRDRLAEIVANRLGLYSVGSSEFLNAALDLFFELRATSSSLRKKPATAELLGWMIALREISNRQENPLAQPELVLRTLSNLIKTAEDQDKAKRIVKQWIEKPQEVNPSWLTPEALIEFIDELRDAGYKIGVSQYIIVQDLILALIAQGYSLDRPQRFKESSESVALPFAN